MTRVSLAVVYIVLVTGTIGAFQLSIVSTHSSLTRRGKFNKLPSVPFLGGGGSGVTSSLISNLAVAALKLRLADQTAVNADVTASSSCLLRGQVGPVTVKGRSWKSCLGLSCRAIEATVNTCKLDMGKIFRDRKLRLTSPALGNAKVALNNDDFGNFITHPLFKSPGTISDNKDERIQFLKDDVRIDSNDGTVTFYGTSLDDKWKFTLERGHTDGMRAIIAASPTHDKSIAIDNNLSDQLTQTVSTFFNEIVLELDGICRLILQFENFHQKD